MNSEERRLLEEQLSKDDQQYVIAAVKKAEVELAAAKLVLRKLQEYCKHPDVVKVNKANTGNYDPAADIYWRDCKCPDCGKFWMEDQ